MIANKTAKITDILTNLCILFGSPRNTDPCLFDKLVVGCGYAKGVLESYYPETKIINVAELRTDCCVVTSGLLHEFEQLWSDLLVVRVCGYDFVCYNPAACKVINELNVKFNFSNNHVCVGKPNNILPYVLYGVSKEEIAAMIKELMPKSVRKNAPPRKGKDKPVQKKKLVGKEFADRVKSDFTKNYNVGENPSLATVLENMGKDNKDIATSLRALAKKDTEVDISSSKNKTKYAWAALAKLKEEKTKVYSDLSNISLTHFAELVTMDDLGSILAATASIGSSLYANPNVKKWVGALMDKGINTVKDAFAYFTNSQTNVVAPTALGALDVCVPHICFAFSPLWPPAADPEDRPKRVYTNWSHMEYSITPNSTGSMLFSVWPQNLYAGGTSASWFTMLNNNVNYDPNSTSATGVNTYSIGPIQPQANVAYNKVKLEGFRIKITPTCDYNSSKGGFLYGMLDTNMSTVGGGLMFQTQICSFTDASRLPTTIYSDAKTIEYLRMIPTDDPSSITFHPTTSNVSTLYDYGQFYFIGRGLDINSSFEISLDVMWSCCIMLAEENFIHPAVPGGGNFTSHFFEALKNKYPNCVYWTHEQMECYLNKLAAVGTYDYNALLKIDPDHDWASIKKRRLQ